MKTKILFKYLLTRMNCLLQRIPYKDGLYIGHGAKIDGSKCVCLNNSVKIMPYSMIVSLKGGKIEIGEGSTVSMFSRIGSAGHIRIGRYVEMGPNCFIADFNHEYRDISVPIKMQGISIHNNNFKPNIEIGDGSWLGTHVVIVGNVNIGKHCVIGANSVVTKDIPDNCVAVGVPAKVIKRYNINSGKWDFMS